MVAQKANGMNAKIFNLRDIGICFIFMTVLLLGSPINAAVNKINITKNIYTQNNELVFEQPVSGISGISKAQQNQSSITRIDLSGRQLLGKSGVMNSDYVAIGSAKNDGGMAMDILDSAGKKIGGLNLSRFQSPKLLKHSIAIEPKSLHAVGTVHELEFYSPDGRLLNQVKVPDLIMVSSFPQSAGQLATVNQKPNSSREKIIKIYNPSGLLIWDFSWLGDGYPEVRIAPDNSRVIIISQVDLVSRIQIMDDKYGQVGQYNVTGVSGFAMDDDSKYLAVTSSDGLIFINLLNGKLIWKKPGSLYAINGGVQFDKSTGKLNVLYVENANPNEYLMEMQIFDPTDGAAVKASLGMVPKTNRNLQLIDISENAKGEKNITFTRESRAVKPGDWKKP